MKVSYKLLYLISSILTLLSIIQVSTVGFAEWYPPGGGQGGP